MKILPRNLVLTKKLKATKTVFRKLTPLSILTCVVALLTCVSVTFAWFGSTFENLNTSITMGNYSATISVYDSNGSIIENKTAQNGESISFENTNKKNGWACGNASAYYIYTDNTGEIDINTYLSFASSFSSSNGTEYNENKEHFAFYVKDITNEVEKANGLSTYIKSAELPTAEEIRKDGSTFADKESVFAGSVKSKKSAVYAFCFCCYDLPDKFVSSEYTFNFSTKITTTQAEAPQTESLELGTTFAEFPTTLSNIESTTPVEPTTSVVAKTEATQSTTSSQKTDTSYASSQNEWVWKYNDSTKKTVSVTAYNGTKSEVVIPSLADGALVTSLGDNLFKNSSVTKVTVPACVKSFKVNTFTCDSLKKLVFQQKTSVDGKVYTSRFISDSKAVYTADKTALVRYLPQACGKEVVVPVEVKAIYDNAFSGCSAEVISIKNVNSFGANTFSGSKLKTFKLYNDEVVVTYGDNVFGSNAAIYVLSELKDAYKDSIVFTGSEVKYNLKTDIYENYPKTEISGIEYVLLKNNDVYNGIKYSVSDYSEFVVITNCKNIPANGTIIIPDTIVCDNKVYNVVAIADGAFKNCKGLETLVLPSHKVSYSSKAFEGCNKLGIIQYNDVLPFGSDVKETAALKTEESTKNTDITEDSNEPTE